ncbi:MAG: SGNH/GDSL hydrolase family protein [Planctomycetia bacterium]|nr:SGNH/GDSL hydrolase family protein [Planctomycetia bacterium]
MTVLMLFQGVVMVTGDEVVPRVTEDGMAWYDASQWPREGQAWLNPDQPYGRLPARDNLPVGVVTLGRQSAGLISHFATDAPFIMVRYRVTGNLAIAQMPATGVSGFDLYCRAGDRWLWSGVSLPEKQEDTLELVSGMDAVQKEFKLYFPLYNEVALCEIGVPEGSWFQPLNPPDGPVIVYYGTSITHGGCVSRPGMTFLSQLNRRMHRTFINMGFAGNARMEPEVAMLLAELNPDLFVIDALPNMTPEQVRDRAMPFIKILRERHAETPILLVEDRSFSNAWLHADFRKLHENLRFELKKAYEQCRAAGDTNIFYLPADELLGESKDFDATTDGSHPSDLGATRMADVLEKTIQQILQ